MDTDPRTDDIIYEEFNGNGKTEMILDRKPHERRTFPAVNIPASGTRREEMPSHRGHALGGAATNMLSAVGQIEGTELPLQRLGKTKTKDQPPASIAKAMEAEKS